MKDKQIKEMVDDIVDNLFNGGIYRLATDLYDLGYRKIPKDSVVLTREQIAEIVSNHNQINKDMVEQARKETAREFAERLKSKDCSVPIHKGFILIEDHAIDQTLKEFIGEEK